MNLEQLEAELPNGLHDSLLHDFSSEPASRRAEFVLDVWLGDLHSSVLLDRERRRPARLDLLGLAYLMVDPHAGGTLTDGLAVQVDVCSADHDPQRAGQVPRGGFAARFFVTEWNAFIHFAAMEARLTWLGVS